MIDKKQSKEKCPTPLQSTKTFDAGFFLKHRRVQLRNVSVLWATILLKKMRYRPPPSLMQKLFRCQNFSENRKRFPTNCFSTGRQRSVDRNLSEAPPLILEILWHQKFYGTQKCSPRRFFGTMKLQKIDKHRDTLSVPRPLLYIN